MLERILCMATRSWLQCVIALVAMTVSVTAFAEITDLDELVVTVRKKEENAQEIPIQVSLYGADMIEKERIRTLEDVALFTPSVQFDTGFWPSDTRISIRGLFARAGRPSAAVLIDGIDAMGEAFESSGGSALLNQRILDLERIEVARGPQSALYGRGAFGGAINYVTRRPEHEWNTSFTVDVAEHNTHELQGTFGGSIVEDQLAFRVLASEFERDGYYTNPNTGGKLGGGESDGVGLAFEWTPSDTVSAYWNTTYSRDKFDPTPIVVVKANQLRVAQNDGMDNITLIPDGTLADCPNPTSGPGGDACLLVVQGTIDAHESQLDLAPDPLTGTMAEPLGTRDYPGTNDKTFRTNLIIDWDISDGLSFRSATSYTDADQRLALDPTNTLGLPMNGIPDGQSIQRDQLNRFEFKQWYQEFQLSGTAENRNWLVGFNAFGEDGENFNGSRIWFRNPGACFFFGPPSDCAYEDADTLDKEIARDTRSYSFFGLVGWNINDDVKLTLEGRLIYDKIEIWTNTIDIMADSLTFAKGFMYARAPGFSDKLDDTNFVPRATLDWFVNDNVMLYGSIAKGIKPPSYNTTDLSDPALARVKKEELWTYEVGAKTQSEDGELTLNGALFYNDYKDQQVRIAFDGLNPGDLPRGGATNAGKTTVWGIEVDATWMPTDSLLFNASWAFTDGEYDDFVLADVQVAGTPVSISNQAKSASKDGDFSGNSTPGNPGHALSLLGKYQAQLSGDTEWFVQGTAQYQDKRWADVANLVELDSYWRASAQIGLEQENWSVSLYAENLFDDDTVEYAQEFIDFQQGFQLTTFSFPVAYYAYLPQPRTVGIKFMYRME